MERKWYSNYKTIKRRKNKIFEYNFLVKKDILQQVSSVLIARRREVAAMLCSKASIVIAIEKL